MKIAEAVQCAAVFLQLNELAEAMDSPDFNANAPEQTLGAENAAELDLLVRCCNLVLFELADADFPLRAQTRVNAENGRIDYSRLPQKITDIVSVTAGGKSARVPIFRLHNRAVQRRVRGNLYFRARKGGFGRRFAVCVRQAEREGGCLRDSAGVLPNKRHA